MCEQKKEQKKEVNAIIWWIYFKIMNLENSHFALTAEGVLPSSLPNLRLPGSWPVFPLALAWTHPGGVWSRCRAQRARLLQTSLQVREPCLGDAAARPCLCFWLHPVHTSLLILQRPKGALLTHTDIGLLCFLSLLHTVCLVFLSLLPGLIISLLTLKLSACSCQRTASSHSPACCPVFINRSSKEWLALCWHMEKDILIAQLLPDLA